MHRERVTAALTGKQSAIVLVDDLDAGVRTVNAYAAEHLEIQTVDAREVAGRIRSAGAIFVGAYSPVSLGDYCAGSNHVLPTAGCARHSSGLSVQTFLKRHPRRRLRRGGAQGRVRLRDHAGQGREPARPRRGGPAEVRKVTAGKNGDAGPTCRCARTCAANRRTAHRNWTFRCGSTPTRTRTRRPRHSSTT